MDWLSQRLIDWLIDWWVVRLSHWLIDCFRWFLCWILSSFACGCEYHLPSDCRTIRHWWRKLAEDANTASYMAAHTKDVSKWDTFFQTCIHPSKFINHSLFWQYSVLVARKPSKRTAVAIIWCAVCVATSSAGSAWEVTGHTFCAQVFSVFFYSVNYSSPLFVLF